MFFNRLHHEKYKDTSFMFKDFSNEYFERIKSVKHNLQYEQIFKIFGQIQSVMVVVGCHNEGYDKPFDNLFDLKCNLVGENLYTEILMELLHGNDPFYNWLANKFSKIGRIKKHIRYLKEEREIENIIFKKVFSSRFR